MRRGSTDVRALTALRWSAQAKPDSPLLELVRGLGLSPFLSTVLLLMAARAEVSGGRVRAGGWVSRLA